MDAVVIDLGCCPHNGDDSINRLIDRYDPVALFGFDPLLGADSTSQIGQTVVKLSNSAAWIGYGELELGVGAFLEGQNRKFLDATLIRDKNHLGEWREVVKVPHFDFGDFLEDISAVDESLIVKMNVEGAEYALLENLYDRNLDSKIAILHVSWHCNQMTGNYAERRKKLQNELRTRVEPWSLW